MCGLFAGGAGLGSCRMADMAHKPSSSHPAGVFPGAVNAPESMAALAGWPSEYIFNVRITGPEAISDRLSQLAAYTDQPQDSGSFNSIVTGTVLPACGGLTLMH